MFCWNCGTQLPDEVSFCQKCGKPQKQGMNVDQSKQVEDSKYETCEIFYRKYYEGTIGGDEGYFVASAIGPEGTYNAGFSGKFSVGYDTDKVPAARKPAHSRAHGALVNKLVSQGWEQSDRGENWYNTRFRRRIDTSWDRCIIDFEETTKGFFGKTKLWARAGGIGGGYNAGDSPIFKGGLHSSKEAAMRYNKEAVEAHRILVEKLIADSWEPIETERFESMVGGYKGLGGA